MALEGMVNYTFGRSKFWQTSPNSEPFVLRWSDLMVSSAAYNRSLDHSTIYVEAGNAAEQFLVNSNLQGNCFNHYAFVSDGFFQDDVTFVDDCVLPTASMALCGYEVCGDLLVAMGIQMSLGLPEHQVVDVPAWYLKFLDLLVMSVSSRLQQPTLTMESAQALLTDPQLQQAQFEFKKAAGAESAEDADQMKQWRSAARSGQTSQQLSAVVEAALRSKLAAAVPRARSPADSPMSGSLFRSPRNILTKQKLAQK